MEKRSHKGQALIEFTFCMVATCLLLIGMIEVFSWVSRDLVLRRQAHEAVLTMDVESNPRKIFQQITPYFYTTSEMKTIPIISDIYGQ